MATATARPQDTAQERDPALQALSELVAALADLDAGNQARALPALTDWLLDALLAGDQLLIAKAVEELRALDTAYRRALPEHPALAERLGRVETLLQLASGAVDRLPAKQDLDLIKGRADEVLRVIRYGQPIRPTDISEQLTLSPAHTTRIINILGCGGSSRALPVTWICSG